MTPLLTPMSLSRRRVSALCSQLMDEEWDTVWVDLRGEEGVNVAAEWWASVNNLKSKRRLLVDDGRGVENRDTDYLCKRLAFCVSDFWSGKRVLDWVKEEEGDDSAKVLEKLKGALKPFTFELPTPAVADLPECELVKAPLSAPQADVYNKTSHSLILGKSTSVIANGLIKLRQLCTSVYDLSSAGGTALLNKGRVDTDLVSDVCSKR